MDNRLCLCLLCDSENAELPASEVPASDAEFPSAVDTTSSHAPSSPLPPSATQSRKEGVTIALEDVQRPTNESPEPYVSPAAGDTHDTSAAEIRAASAREDARVKTV